MAAKKATDSQTLIDILASLSAMEAHVQMIDSRICKLDEHHDRHTESLDELRSRMDRLDGAKGLAMVLIGVVGVMGSVGGWLFGKM